MNRNWFSLRVYEDFFVVYTHVKKILRHSKLHFFAVTDRSASWNVVRLKLNSCSLIRVLLRFI
jgi:hypothetical protein